MKPRFLAASLLGAAVLLIMVMLAQASSSVAQDQRGRIQRITGRMNAGETDAYLLKGLRAGDTLTVTMRATSGNLDPAMGIVDTTIPLEEVMARHRAEVQRLLAGNGSMALALEGVRNQTFLAWDDDSDDGYAAALAYVIPAAGDYGLITWGSLSAFGRETSGDYELLIGLNAPAAQAGQAEPAGAPIAERVASTSGLSASVEEASGTLSAAAPTMNFELAEINDGQTFTAFVEPTSGNLIPMLILRDYGGKPLEAGNLGGREPKAALRYGVTEDAAHYSLDLQAASLPDATRTEGGYRLLVGVNAPDVLTGQAQP